VLLISAALEGLEWRTARRQLRAEAAARHLDLGEYLVTSSDPTPTAVFLEDSAALVGIALALAALVLHVTTGSALWDGVASLLIGLLLIVVAYLLMRRNLALLIDEAAPADVRERLRQAVAREPWVAEVAELTAVYIGPRQLLMLVHVVPVGVAVLLVSAGLEGMSWRTARRQLRAEAAARHLDLGEYVATSSDPTATAVFLEDSAALIGLALALVALLLHIMTGSAVWDGAASLLIGLLLVVVAYLLMRRNLALLIDEAAPAEVRERLGQAVAKEPWVVEVAELTAVYIGPKQLLVLIHVVPVDGTDLTASVGRLRHRLLAVPAIAAVEITPVERAH
jgi:divalent metal cation (Fe/Co/Zn/Cd) transporter